MKLSNFTKQLFNVDKALTGAVTERRRAIKNITTLGGRMALATIPTAIGALFNSAYAATPLSADAVEQLNMMLVLEKLGASLYSQGIAAANLIPADHLQSLKQIFADDTAHVTYLQNLLGTQAKPAPVFDYTGGGGTNNGQFRDIFKFYGTFLNVAQAIKEISLRGYQGIFPAFAGNQDVLTALFNIHSLESRHSAHIHQLGYKLGNRPMAPWIVTGDGDRNGLFNTEFYAVYADEENQVQLGVPGLGNPAFDEPMKPYNVKQLLNNLFISSPKLA